MNFVRTTGYCWVIWKFQYFRSVLHVALGFDPGFSGNFGCFWNPRGFWVNFQDWFSIRDKGPSWLMIQSSTAAKPRTGWRPRTSIVNSMMIGRKATIQGLPHQRATIIQGWLPNILSVGWARTKVRCWRSAAGPVWSVFLWGRKAGPPDRQGTNWSELCVPRQEHKKSGKLFRSWAIDINHRAIPVRLMVGWGS